MIPPVPPPGAHVRFRTAAVPGLPSLLRWGVVRGPHPLQRGGVLVDPLWPRMGPGRCWEVFPHLCPLTPCHPLEHLVAEVMGS